MQGQLNLSEGLIGLKHAVNSESSSPAQFNQVIDRYGLLGGAVEQVQKKDIISPIPDTEPSGSNDYARSRIRTMRNRLANLGYLKTDNKHDRLDKALKNGIKKFQRDAAITVDGWVGQQTWLALQALVSFEDASQISRWFKDGQPNPALTRATQLRLFALGLISDKPGRAVMNLKPSLQQFSEICRILCLTDEYIAAELCQETLSVLFDQDELIKRLSTSKAPTAKAVRIKIHAFVMSLAKIELWMLGFSINPDGNDSRPVPLRIKKGISVSMNRSMELKQHAPLYKALVSYWAIHKGDKTRARVPARLFIKSSYPSFFTQLLKDTATETAMDADEVYGCLEEKQISMDTVWQHVKSFGSRLWDGMKRIWGWFRNIIRQAAKAVASFIKNISRLAYQYILKSYEAVKAVIKGFCNSVTYLIKPEIEMPSGVKTVIRHDGDFDFKILVHKSDPAEQVTLAADRLIAQSRIFSLSGRVLAALIAALKSITAGIIGWAWMLMGLLKLYKCIAQLAPELIALQKKISV